MSKAFASNLNPTVHCGRCEMDSHADAFVAGKNCCVMNHAERVCNVVPCSDDHEAKTSVPIAQAGTGFALSNGKRHVLVFNEALWSPELSNSLLNPNQLRHFGVKVQDDPCDAEPMTISKEGDSGDFVACLKSQGTNVFIDTWTPTADDSKECPKIIMTSDMPWNPHEVEFPRLTGTEFDEIESFNVSNTGTDSRRADDADYQDPCLQPLRIFDIQAFNARIMKSRKVPIIQAQGPLHEDELMPPKIFVSSDRHSNTTPEDLSEAWNVSIEQAKMTLEATTQHHARSAIMPLSRRCRMDRMFEPLRLRCEMASDAMDPRCVGLHGDRCCQVFGNKHMFVEACPICKKSDCDDALKSFIREHGAPDAMITDGSREQTSRGTAFQATLRKNKIASIVTQPNRPNQNPAETVVRELRKKWHRAIFRANCPRALWNCGLPHFAKIMQLTAANAAGLQGRTPIEVVAGETPDMSQHLDFGWHDWVWHKENAKSHPPAPSNVVCAYR